MEFSTEEISLCKQIAEKHRKETEYGDWYWDRGLKKAIVLCVKLSHIQNDPYFIKNCLPLWTISDCLEFLRKKPRLHTIEIIGDFLKLQWHICLNWTDIKDEGKTPLEACLKAVLAVIEED